MRRLASRRIDALKPPAKPRSEVATTIRCTSSRPVPASNGGAPGIPAMRPASEPSTRSIRVAYGRAASACSCARRRREAATIFIAAVIFCVERTLRMRFRRSFRLAIGQFTPAHDPGESRDRGFLSIELRKRPGEIVEEGGQRLFGRIGDLALSTDRSEQFGGPGTHIAQHQL